MLSALRLARRGVIAGRGTLSYAQTVLADSPAIYMPFDEPTVAPVDATGNHTPSVVGSGITSIADGPLGKRAYRFPNNTASRISVPDAASLDLGNIFTTECWYRPIGTAAYQALISKGSGVYYMRATNTGALSLLASQVQVICTSTTTMTNTAKWYHVAATKTGATVKLYIDAVDVSGSVSDATFGNNNAPLTIGADFNSNTVSYSEPLNGDIAQVAVYPTALSATRVSAHYAAAV